jgi:hypothetical protein
MSQRKKNLFSRTKLGIAKGVFPLKSPSIFFLDNINIYLPLAHINQINVPSLLSPAISENYCLGSVEMSPESVSLSFYISIECDEVECNKKFIVRIKSNSIGKQIRFGCPKCNHLQECRLTENFFSCDYSQWIKDQFFIPEIEQFSLLKKRPKYRGKVYKIIEKLEQDDLFLDKEGDKECIHGLRKSWCSICVNKERQERQVERNKVDLFDLILPILQPPLGENFDNALVMPYKLYDFQRAGIKFLAEREAALLADEMGLGKTIQAILALRFLFHQGKIENCLILCPRSILANWEKELWEWAPELRVSRLRGSPEQRRIAWSSKSHIYITTYETLARDLAGTVRTTKSKSVENLSLFSEVDDNEIENITSEDIAKNEFDLALLDEIQKIKNPEAIITKAARSIGAKIKWGLSGTPLENRAEELIAIFHFLKPGLLKYKFAASPEIIKKRINEYFLRRKKAEALPELPDKVHDEKWLELTHLQREAYDEFERKGKMKLSAKGESIKVTHILALITKLKEICNFDPRTNESCKLEYLTEALEEVTDQDDKALVFSQYPNKTIKSIEPHLSKYNPLIYHGSLSDKQRKMKVNIFQKNDDNKVLLMSVKAGGLGLNLTRACYVFHFDFWWNPSVASQAEDRAHRIGQKKTVFVTSLFTKDTIEERIQKILNRKRKIFKDLIDDLSDNNLKNVLTEDELFNLFGLKKPGITGEKMDEKSGRKTNLEELSPQEFEELIRNLYEKMGFHTKMTPQSRDKGVDIYAKRSSESGSEYLVIQCKHYQKGVVGVEHARALYGVVHSNQKITKGVLITSGKFSNDCREFAENKRIDLMDGGYLRGLLGKYKMFQN